MITTDDDASNFRHALARRAPFAHERQRRGEPQDHCKEVKEFLEKAQPKRCGGNPFHAVRAKFAQPAQGFGSGQSLRSAVQARNGVGCRELSILTRRASAD